MDVQFDFEVFASGSLLHDLLNYLFTLGSDSKEWQSNINLKHGIHMSHCMYIQYCVALLKKCIMFCVNKCKLTTDESVFFILGGKLGFVFIKYD